MRKEWNEISLLRKAGYKKANIFNLWGAIAVHQKMTFGFPVQETLSCAKEMFSKLNYKEKLGWFIERDLDEMQRKIDSN